LIDENRETPAKHRKLSSPQIPPGESKIEVADDTGVSVASRLERQSAMASKPEIIVLISDSSENEEDETPGEVSDDDEENRSNSGDDEFIEDCRKCGKSYRGDRNDTDDCQFHDGKPVLTYKEVSLISGWRAW
jgi:hypothetical protein